MRAAPMKTRPAKRVGDSALFFRLCLAVILTMLAGCDAEQRAPLDRYQSKTAVAEFLRRNYFEVEAEPVPLEDFTYLLLDGRREMLSANRGKLVFLNFWATWCYPCRKEMPDMEVLADSLKKAPFRMLAVNFGDETEQVRRFVERHRYTFDILIDQDKSIASRLAVQGLPTTVIIDGKGRVLARLIGPANWKDEEFKHVFEALSFQQ